ncbi:E3 ubiquitin-protein ligase TRIM33-like [Hydractinia symbiolongicarpus]|uniref:E3 ubiquitin-protein ligase TRIM33-like n=1 Tax=Hydractinia symbiolongicarpus TaxID=13093 RepID=UPI0025503AD6|nr:E3 ubiquitin-protein ligase TRIM33-like [Hydractinia symbiolongicarpus]XP_057294493.1 E3 ubiquitin-protein ligase TRIM33-like [Hydractinia symbiolongicarpus]
MDDAPVELEVAPAVEPAPPFAVDVQPNPENPVPAVEDAPLDAANIDLENNNGAEHNNTGEKPDNVKNVNLDCSVCNDRFKDPKLLSCMHTFCMECLRPVHREYNGMMAVQCMSCSTITQVDDLETLPSNLLAKNLVEAIQAMNEENSKETQCDDCEEDVPTTYCLVCHQKLCDACVLDHKRKRKFKGHNMALLKDVTQEELVRSFYHLCKKHGKELELYCETCDAVVCQTCTRSRQHIDHRHLLLEEIVGEKKEILEIILKTTKEKELATLKAIDDAERENLELMQTKERSILEIKSVFEIMRAHLLEQETKLIDEINHIFNDGVTSIAKSKGITTAFSNCMTYFETLEKNGMDTEFMYVFRDLKSHLESISSSLEGNSIQLTSVILEKREDYPPEQSFQILSEEYVKCLNRNQQNHHFPQNEQ